MMEKLLATFKVNSEEGQKLFNIYGDYKISEDNELEPVGCSATKVENGKEVKYTPAGNSLYGIKYAVQDMLKHMISCYIAGNEKYTPLYLDFGIQEYVDTFQTTVARETEGKVVPSKK